MQLFLGLALHLGLSQAMAVTGSETVWGPPKHPKRHGGGGGGYQPINIDLTAWKPAGIKQQWYGDITVGTPPQTL